MTNQEIKKLCESKDRVVRDKYGVCWYKIPKDMTLTPCTKFCNFWDNKRGCVSREIVKELDSKNFMRYCYDLRRIASIYGSYMVPIDIPEEFFIRSHESLIGV